MSKKRENKSGIPDFELESLARMLLPKIQYMFKDEKMEQEFQRWMAEREKKMKNSTKENG